jgi:hypothetical protein
VASGALQTSACVSSDLAPRARALSQRTSCKYQHPGQPNSANPLAALLPNAAAANAMAAALLGQPGQAPGAPAGYGGYAPYGGGGYGAPGYYQPPYGYEYGAPPAADPYFQDPDYQTYAQYATQYQQQAATARFLASGPNPAAHAMPPAAPGQEPMMQQPHSVPRPPGVPAQSCSDWLRGRCQRGDSCKYSHDRRDVEMCRDYLKGLCQRPSCRYNHDRTSLCREFIVASCDNDNCPYVRAAFRSVTPCANACCFASGLSTIPICAASSFPVI